MDQVKTVFVRNGITVKRCKSKLTTADCINFKLKANNVVFDY